MARWELWLLPLEGFYPLQTPFPACLQPSLPEHSQEKFSISHPTDPGTQSAPPPDSSAVPDASPGIPAPAALRDRCWEHEGLQERGVRPSQYFHPSIPTFPGSSGRSWDPLSLLLLRICQRKSQGAKSQGAVPVPSA